MIDDNDDDDDDDNNNNNNNNILRSTLRSTIHSIKIFRVQDDIF